MTDEKFDSEMNFSKVLFLHLNRTAQSVGQTDLFMANIDVFELFLLPYQDDDYRKDVKGNISKSQALIGLDALTPNKKDMNRSQAISNSTHKLGCLMCLAERKGLLLEKTDRSEIWEIPKDDENAVDNSVAE